MDQNPSLYAQLNLPYYIWAPPYQQGSGGIRAMHLLCHALNLLGEEAYVTTSEVNPDYRTPTVTEGTISEHVGRGRQPIVVYPEVIHSNPLNAYNVVRYLLSEPGRHTGMPIELGAHDLVYTFDPTLVPDGWRADMLRVPLVDPRIFTDEGVEPGSREGSAVFLNRYLYKDGPLDPITRDSIEISPRQPRGPVELAQVLRSVELLYTYEQSTIVYEAVMCGCPVVYLPNQLMLERPITWLYGGNGVAWGADPAAIAHAKATVRAAQDVHRDHERQFWNDVRSFIGDTQANAVRVAPA